jgi:hypothetical protein
MLRIVGIDPGNTGALALICGGVVLDCIDVPLMPDNSQVQVDGAKLCKWIDKHQPIDLVVIENVQPRQGSGDGESMASGKSFRFGMVCGELRMAFKCYGIPIQLVTPGQWKRAAGLLKSTKAKSRQKALQAVPSAAIWLSRGLDHNRAEAVLIGLYAEEKRGML